MSAQEAGKWFTRPGLAVVLHVSVSTVDRMMANDELPRVKVRGRVRFYLPDVEERLLKGNRKFGRGAELTAEIAKRGPAVAGNPNPEAGVRMAAGGVK